MSTIIPGISNSAAHDAAPSTVTPTGNAALGKDQFLQILVAQLQNQDPTQPQDSSAFVAELAQFSSLEAQQNSVTDLDALMVGQATANSTAATSFIGKEINFTGGNVNWDGTKVVNATVTVPSGADKLTVAVADPNGNVIRTLQLGSESAGDVKVTWDGRDNAGDIVVPAQYTLSTAAFDANGNAVPSNLSTSGVVTGVQFQGGVPYLQVGSSVVQMSNVTSINERNTP